MIKTALLLVLLVPGVVLAQTESAATATRLLDTDRTQGPAEARFEVIRTFGTDGLTLKLDRCTGVVYELAPTRGFVKGKDDQFSWQPTRLIAHPQDNVKPENRVNYQIFTSRTGPIATFLVNVNTGATWVLSRDIVKGQSYWYPIALQGAGEPEGE